MQTRKFPARKDKSTAETSTSLLTKLSAAHRLLVLLFSCTLFFAGCGPAVQHTLSPDYHEKMPEAIAVLPISGDEGDADARYLFRTMIYDTLVQMNYAPIPLETVDNVLLRTGIGRNGFDKKGPKELAEVLKADSLVYTTITKWDTTLFVAYASIKIGARVELYGGKTGDKLWEAEYKTKESDMRMEQEVMELGITKAYEPVIQRVVSALFSTLPQQSAESQKKSKKSYFDWLP